ncbi:MAG: hypothetical protein JSV56_05590 [Methanomassiliicoccales archaeon]|nr:MAG: hypothetical protein JSV56_05590 [Methanomassiliicoccales archaeon]
MANRRTRFTKARNKNRNRPVYEKEAKLNLRNLYSFEYLLREILADSSMNEDFTNAFIANVITKGSRASLKEAKDYVRSLAKEGVLENETSDEIIQLLDRNRKYR